MLLNFGAWMRTGLSNMAERPLANGLILMIRVRIPPINLGQDSHLCMKQWSRSPKIDGFSRSSVFWVKNCSNKLLSSQDFKSWISRKQKLQIKINSNGSSRCRKKDNETKLTTWIWSGCQKFSSNRSIKFWRAEVRLRPTFEASPLCLSSSSSSTRP